jgi:endonuclease-3
MLSSQTKDEVTAAAVKQLCEKGLTVNGILALSDSEVDSCIAKVGFHNRKTK